MDKRDAEIVVKNLLGRLRSTGGDFELPSGIISQMEKEALELFSGLAANKPQIAHDFSEVTLAPIELELRCLSASPDASAILCIDFGTAFSKAALWRTDETVPVPLDLARGANPASTGVLLESAVYITGDVVFFGPEAVEKYRLEDSPDRELFASPKELLTHEVARLNVERPSKAVDPTGKFTSRALLTLYLAYLTAVVCDVLPAGIRRTVKRRYAAPGWGNAQADVQSKEMGAAARSLGDLLVDAQILADTIDIIEWRNGLACERALELDRAIQAERSDPNRLGATFVERAVLEAVAAASGIRDQFLNKRPQVLVVDVGAGTTDIGVFKFVNSPDAKGVVAPYRGGMRAIQTAGNALDDALIGLAQQKIGLPSGGDRSRRFRRRLGNVIREAKATLCETGEIEIDVPDFPQTKIDLAEFERTPTVKHFVREFEANIVGALEGSGASFRSFSDDSVAVFTGGGGSLPFLRNVLDKKAVSLKDGPAYFLIDDAIPDWVNRTLPDVSKLFPQIAVAAGGCSPFLPKETGVVGDTSDPGKRELTVFYKS